MPIQIEWYDETRTIQILTFAGDWTAADFFEAVNKAVVMGNEVPHSLDILCDMRGSGEIPSSAISLARWALMAKPGKMKSLVVVTENDFLRVLSRAINSLYPKLWRNVRLVKTLEEAQRLIGKECNSGTRTAE
jgi:hypothetical protein